MPELTTPADFVIFLAGVLVVLGIILAVFHVFGSKPEQATPDADFYESAWERLADNSNFDPVTVAVCKRLRDLEVEGMRS